MDRMSSDSRQRGLTLVELMITLVVLAVTATLAGPGMQQLIQSNNLRTETSRLLDALNLARSEAVIRNVPVSLCPSFTDVAGVIRCAGHYADGWVVFTNRDRDSDVDAGSDEVLRVFKPVPAGYSVSNLAGTRAMRELITYLPDGSSRRNQTLLLCPPWPRAVPPWSVVLNSTGRPRVSRGDGHCPAPGA